MSEDREAIPRRFDWPVRIAAYALMGAALFAVHNYVEKMDERGDRAQDSGIVRIVDAEIMPVMAPEIRAPVDVPEPAPNVGPEPKGYKYPKGSYGNLKEFMTTNYSPNCSKSEVRRVEGIVVHTTEGSGNGAEAWLTNPQSNVSAHYLIKENGDVVNLVEESNVAWHCRGHNQTTIGIEFAGYHDRALNPTQLDVGHRLIQYLCDKYDLDKDDVHAHSELDSSRRKDPGQENMERILAGID